MLMTLLSKGSYNAVFMLLRRVLSDLTARR